MGQYHLVANLDKREFLYPHEFGDGFKLMEFGQSSGGTLTGLAILLAASNGRGGGDFFDTTTSLEHHPGCWAGDRIAIIGDYFEDGDVPGLTLEDMADLWSDDPKTWTDISLVVSKTMLEAGEMGEWQQQTLTRRKRLTHYTPYSSIK
jgi:hypothetical protein